MLRRFRTPLLLLVLAALGFALAPPVAAQVHAYYGRNKVQYEGFDWHVLHTDHFDVYYYPEARELAEHGAHFAEEAYDELRHRFDFALSERVPLIFYSSNLHFKQTNVTPGFIPDGVGGFFEFLKGRVVIPANGDLHRFRRVVRHELVHVFTFSKLARVMRDHRKPMQLLPPLWFTEGLAEYWSGEPDFQHEMVLRDAVASNYLVPLGDLDRIAGSYLMYKEGEAVLRFFAEEYGEEKILLLFENFWRDTDFRKVVEHVFQEKFETTSERWGRWVREQYYPMFEEATPPSLAAEPVAAGGFHSKPVLYERSDGTRLVAYVANRDGYSNLWAVEVDSAGAPVADPRVLVKGGRGPRFEAFHLFESRMDVDERGQLAFVTKSGEADVVHVYDLEAGRVGETFRFPDLVAVYSPTWSPDGRLAFTGIERSGFADLYTYDPATDALRKLTNDPYDDRDPAWSPDGRHLAFASDRTDFGEGGAYNLFTYDLDTDRVAFVTYGDHKDLSPRWSPDGDRLVFISTRRQEDGKFSGQDLWTVDVTRRPGTPVDPVLAEAAAAGATAAPDSAALAPTRTERRLTAFTGAAFDPVWTDGGEVVFTTFDSFRFTIRRMDADSLVKNPQATAEVGLVARSPEARPWRYDRLTADPDDAERQRPYRRQYSLDVAQGAVSTNPLWGASGGAVLAFSDLLGDDRIFVTAYATEVPGGSFVDGLNVAVSRFHLGRRANVGYGAFRFSGLRYDRTDPDADATYPFFFEQLTGGFGAVSYPLSTFQRVEVTGSLAWNHKRVAIADVDRDALLYQQAVGLTHDNALYGFNGPVDGWKANLQAAYTTDLRFSNVSYYTLSADLRRYTRLGPLTLAHWGMARTNVGREARLFLLGGSWDLRGFPFLRVRGRNLWFTSHELRFPLAYAPSAYIPILAPFGIANLRGALFADAARAWNDAYDQREDGLYTGRTLGALGAGLRINIFGGFVLRYDTGWRFEDGLDWGERERFNQVFFGYDF